jgi:signal transduction histidine kinase
MFDAIQMPLLKGMQATECGFSFAQNKWSHIGLGKDWQTQSFKLNNGSETLIVANHIGQSLQSARYESNLSLIRVLTHELNNSLTPFISITDTLLAEPTLPLEATRSALSRIKSRSESLLSFIHGYRELTKIAPATWAFFDLKEMVLLNAKEQGLAVTYSGYDTCCGDGILMEQFLINLFINAKEAKANAIQLEFLTKGKMQYLSIVDNGPGFSNLDNVLQPLYTTKADGQGLGLALCNTISHQHDGQLDVSNASPNGAKIQFTFPIRCR